MPDCLTGLATVQDISLETSLDYLFNFIINNLGYTCLDYGPGKQRFTRLTEPGVSFFKRQEIIYVSFSRTLTTKSSRRSSPSSLDLSPFSKEELLALVRRTPELSSPGIYGLDIFKDRIFVYYVYHDKDDYGDDIFFFPQHFEKLYS